MHVKGLDIGVGANCIYPILAQVIYGWTMVGSDINQQAVKAAKKNVALNTRLTSSIEIRQQLNHANIFKGIIEEGEYYDFTLCNPPFHRSEKEATKGTLRKHKNLKLVGEITLNFGGQSNELWCNGGESLFIKRMIKESVLYAKQVGWFTVLVAKKEHLLKLRKQLNKMQATHKIITMEQGVKKSRILAWQFN
jgi:23S rRNA (adenine1618-N6)-methyltransferase